MTFAGVELNENGKQNSPHDLTRKSVARLPHVVPVAHSLHAAPPHCLTKHLVRLTTRQLAEAMDHVHKMSPPPGSEKFAEEFKTQYAQEENSETLLHGLDICLVNTLSQTLSSGLQQAKICSWHHQRSRTTFQLVHQQELHQRLGLQQAKVQHQ